MSEHIVKELRDQAGRNREGNGFLMSAAADEIELLRAERAAILNLCDADYALAEPTWAVETDKIRDILEPHNSPQRQATGIYGRRRVSAWRDEPCERCGGTGALIGLRYGSRGAAIITNLGPCFYCYDAEGETPTGRVLTQESGMK